MADGRVVAVGVGYALVEATRDAHSHVVQIELLDRQHATETNRRGWRPHLIRGRAEVETWSA